MFSILAGSKGRDLTEIQGAVLLVVTNEADGEAEAEVDEVAYLDTRASVTTEEDVTTDADVDVEDIFIEEDTEVVADGDTPVLISTMVDLAD